MGELTAIELEMGIEKRLESEVRFDPRSPSRSEPLTEVGVVEEARDRGSELLRITWRDEQSGLSLDHELWQPSHTWSHDRKAGRHGFQNRDRKGFRSARENEDIRSGKNLRHVLALSGEVDGSGQPESPKLGLDGRPIRPVPYDERLKPPTTQLCEGANERERVLGRLQAPNRDDPGWMRPVTGDRTRGGVDPVVDHDRRRLVASSGGNSRRAVPLRDTHGGCRQRPDEPFRPAEEHGAEPGNRSESPSVHGEDPDRSPRRPGGDPPEHACLRAARVDDVRAHAAHEDDELQEAEQIAPDADRPTNMSQRNVFGTCLSGSHSQGPGSMGRYGDVVAADQRRDEGRDIRLSTPRLGERHEQEDPRGLGHLGGRKPYRVISASRAFA